MENKKRLNKFKQLIVFLLFISLVLFTSCNDEKPLDSEYKVCFIYNANDQVISNTNSSGYVVMPSKAPTKEHAEFLGWYLGDEEFDFSMPITSDITLVARFLIDEEYAKEFNVNFIVDGEVYKSSKVLEDRKASQVKAPKKEGRTFDKWVIKDTDIEFTFGSPITKDLDVIAKYVVEQFEITFIAEGEKNVVKVDYGKTVPKPSDPKHSELIFVDWMYKGEVFDFSTLIYSNMEIVARFKHDIKPYKISYDFGYDCFQTKNDLRDAFYADFYNFLVEKEVVELEQNNITSLDEFLSFMTTWCVDPTGARKDLYHTGDAFGKYYVTKDVDGVIENQPVDTFVGYCYQNNMYRDLLNHLITFFAYWRTDEGYTTSTNHGNDFFYDGWASLVDTAKFFYFTSSNIATKYAWFTSPRVHYALDHVPGVGYVTLVTDYDDYYTLPTDVTREGYEFVGWVDKDNNPIIEVFKDITVYAKWRKVGD